MNNARPRDPEAIHRLYGRLNHRFRVRRMRRFVAVLKPTAGDRILDVGGTEGNWLLLEEPLVAHLLNIRPPTRKLPGFEYSTGDALALPYPDRAWDIVFSNSLIEHVGTADAQRRAADEMRRVGRRLWIQTPAREFFLEPHYIGLLTQFVPPRWTFVAVRYFSLWGLLQRPSRDQVNDLSAELRLLRYAEMRSLFPDCEILIERFLGFRKSYIAVREEELDTAALLTPPKPGTNGIAELLRLP